MAEEVDPIFSVLENYIETEAARDAGITSPQKVSLKLRGGHDIRFVSIDRFNETNEIVYVTRPLRTGEPLTIVRIADIVAVVEH